MDLGGKPHPLQSVSRKQDHIDDVDDDWGLQEVRGSHLISIKSVETADTTGTSDLIGTAKSDSRFQDVVSRVHVGEKLDAVDGKNSNHPCT